MTRDPVLTEALARVRRALDADRPRSQWIQIASADEEGVAHVRTVVLHGVDDAARLLIATDAASAKVRDLRRVPRAEACLLARDSLEQFRFTAHFEVVDAERARREPERGARRRDLWRAMPPREKGYYVSPPGGLPFESFPPGAFHAEAHEPEPVERFCFLEGELEAIDVLDVSRTPHDRVLYAREGGRWTRRALTP